MLGQHGHGLQGLLWRCSCLNWRIIPHISIEMCLLAACIVCVVADKLATAVASVALRLTYAQSLPCLPDMPSGLDTACSSVRITEGSEQEFQPGVNHSSSSTFLQQVKNMSGRVPAAAEALPF